MKKSGEERKIRKYSYKAMTNTPLSLFKSTRHLVCLRTRKITFFKIFTLLPNLNKCARHGRKQQYLIYKKSKQNSLSFSEMEKIIQIKSLTLLANSNNKILNEQSLKKQRLTLNQ